MGAYSKPKSHYTQAIGQSFERCRWHYSAVSESDIGHHRNWFWVIANIWCYIKMPLKHASRCYSDEVDQSLRKYSIIHRLYIADDFWRRTVYCIACDWRRELEPHNMEVEAQKEWGNISWNPPTLLLLCLLTNLGQIFLVALGALTNEACSVDYIRSDHWRGDPQQEQASRAFVVAIDMVSPKLPLSRKNIHVLTSSNSNSPADRRQHCSPSFCSLKLEHILRISQTLWIHLRILRWRTIMVGDGNSMSLATWVQTPIRTERTYNSIRYHFFTFLLFVDIL